MDPQRIMGWIGVVAASLLLMSCQSRKIDNTMTVDPDEPVSFSQDVLPILKTSCGGSDCHIGERTNGVNLSNYDQVMTSTGTQYGMRIVVPGEAENSPLIDKIRPDPEFGVRMPASGAPLSGEQIATIRTWINDGAPDN